MKSDQTIIRKYLMEHINNTTLLIGIKDKNITLNQAIQYNTHVEVIATLDYHPPKYKYCKGKQIKYDFQKPSKIPFIEIGGFPSLIRLKKRRFQCKSCQKVTVSETSLVHFQEDFNTKKIITILDNRRQTAIRNHFFRYSKEARNRVKVVEKGCLFNIQSST